MFKTNRKRSGYIPLWRQSGFNEPNHFIGCTESILHYSYNRGGKPGASTRFYTIGSHYRKRSLDEKYENINTTIPY